MSKITKIRVDNESEARDIVVDLQNVMYEGENFITAVLGAGWEEAKTPLYDLIMSPNKIQAVVNVIATTEIDALFNTQEE